MQQHASLSLQDGGAAFGIPAEGDAAAGNRQRRDSSPAQLAFTNQLPVSTQVKLMPGNILLFSLTDQLCLQLLPVQVMSDKY